jgi:hypothetical protein
MSFRLACLLAFETAAAEAQSVGRLLCPRSQGAAVRTADENITSVLATTDVDKALPHAYNLTMISSDFHPTRWSVPYGQ